MLVAICLAACWAGTAQAGPPQYDLNVPMFGAQDSQYDFVTAPAQDTGSIPAPPVTLPDSYRLGPSIHGAVTAGVATQGGHVFAGTVEMPIIAGKLDLAAGAATGQTGGLAGAFPGGKRGTLTYDQYFAALHLHPADNLDAYIGVSGGQFRLPLIAPAETPRR